MGSQIGAQSRLQTGFTKSDQTILTLIKKLSDKVQSRANANSALNEGLQASNQSAQCIQKLQNRLAQIRRSSSRSPYSFSAKQVGQNFQKSQVPADQKENNSAGFANQTANPQISVASDLNPEE